MMWCGVLQKERDCGQMDMTGLIIDLVFATFVGFQISWAILSKVYQFKSWAKIVKF